MNTTVECSGLIVKFSFLAIKTVLIPKWKALVCNSLTELKWSSAGALVLILAARYISCWRSKNTKDDRDIFFESAASFLFSQLLFSSNIEAIFQIRIKVFAMHTETLLLNRVHKRPTRPRLRAPITCRALALIILG